MEHTPRPLRGILYMLLAMSVVPFIDIAAKLIAHDLHVMEATLGRYVFHFLWLLPIFAIMREPIIKPVAQPIGQIMRGACLVLTTIFFFMAIRDNAIPDALGLVFIAPLLATLLSPIFLGEKIGVFRIGASLIGFAGSLIVIKPTGEFNPSILWALVASMTFAGYFIATKKLDGRDTPLTSQFITAIVGIIIALPFMLWFWQTPNGFQLLMMVVMGAASALGHYLIIMAFREAEVSLLAPFDYFEIITAALFSLVIFGTFPALNIWIGVAIIAAAGVTISYREYVLGKQKSYDESGAIADR